MSNTRIIEIPATMQTGKGKNHAIRKLRVAAYCRVSTEEEEQQSSFETQKLYYTEKITSTPEWEIAGIYADDGISGVHTKKRDGFNQMIQDCKKRKIDLILTKSISRFARNTLDSIQYVRMLKALGIAVIFEKENINTSTMNSEMILTVLSAFAQAESESISQNVARGKRMGFRQGKFPFPYRQILGYRKGSDGKPEIIPEEAEVIRIPETELHQAILKAVQNLAAKFTGEVADQLNGILHQIEVGESLTPQLQAQLEQNQQEFDHLLEMSLDFDENTPFLDDKLKRLSDKIKQLKTAITQSSVNSQTPSTPTNPITAKDLLITEYDDMLTARIIEKIIVKSRQDLEIIFIGGYTQQISLQ